MHQDKQQSGFAITENKGFSIQFNNGLTISVQFGYINFCDNKNHPGGIHFQKNLSIVHSTTAEIAIWDQDGNWFNFGSNYTFMGYCQSEEVAIWIQLVSTATDLEDLHNKAIEARAIMPA